jgi:hypothetical protein
MPGRFAVRRSDGNSRNSTVGPHSERGRAGAGGASAAERAVVAALLDRMVIASEALRAEEAVQGQAATKERVPA